MAKNAWQDVKLLRYKIVNLEFEMIIVYGE